MNEIEQLHAEIDGLLGICAGLNAVIVSLIATHPNYNHLQLHLAGATEVAVEGSFGRSLPTEQAPQIARTVAEELQRIREVPLGTLPTYRPPSRG